MGKLKVIYSSRCSIIACSFICTEGEESMFDKHASKQVAKHFNFPNHF